MNGKKNWIRLLIPMLALSMFFFVWCSIPHYASGFSKQDLNINQLGDRILFFSPHPDDEVLGGGGIIQKAINSGKQVTVVLMTTGDGFADDAKVVFRSLYTSPSQLRKLAVFRHHETIQALESLGVKQENIIFLGYPDGGIDQLWGENWSCQKPYQALNGYEHSPYSFSYQKDATYCGENVLKNVKEIIQKVKPTAVIYPDPNDQHPDHWATGAFVDQALMEEHLQVLKLYYLVHADRFLWPYKHTAKPPEYLKTNGANFFFHSLSKREQKHKQKAILQYKTQLKVMGPWMEQFIRDQDVFETYPEPQLFYDPHPKLDGNHGFPYPLIHNELTSLLNRPGLHISEIGGVYSDKEFYIGFATSGKIQATNTYEVNLRLFKPKQVNCLQFSIHDGKVSFSSSNSQIQSVFLNQSSQQAWLILPRDVLNHVQHIFVSVDVTKQGQRLEHTPWRFIK